MALLTSYSYAKLSVAYPSPGGTVEFLNHGLGTGLITGSLNVLLSMSYIIMLSLYAHAFGSYGAGFLPDGWQALGSHVLLSVVVIALTVLGGMLVLSVGVEALYRGLTGREIRPHLPEQAVARDG